MIEQIKQLVEQVSTAEAGKENISGALINSISQETGNSVISGLKNSISNGDISSLTNLFNGNSAELVNNPMVGGMITNLVESLTSKLGLSEEIASNFAGNVIPQAIEMISSKVQGGESGFQINDLIGGLGEGGISDLIGSFTGGKEGLGGVVDLFKKLF